MLTLVMYINGGILSIGNCVILVAEDEAHCIMYIQVD